MFLGYEHEHTRTDRDLYINVIYDNIKKNYTYNFDKCKTCDTLGTPYDFESIMHYPDDAFAVDPRKKTIVPKNGQTITNPNTFSHLDLLKIRRHYPCSK